MIDGTSAASYLATEIAWDAEPELSDDEREALLLAARAIDTAGKSPGATGYVTTYTQESLDGAVYLGWRRKLAKANEFSQGDEKVIFDHCKFMVMYWAKVIGLSGTAVGGFAGSGTIAIPNRAVW